MPTKSKLAVIPTADAYKWIFILDFNFYIYIYIFPLDAYQKFKGYANLIDLKFNSDYCEHANY